jgi:hypothetical protein
MPFGKAATAKIRLQRALPLPQGDMVINPAPLSGIALGVAAANIAIGTIAAAWALLLVLCP